jgi:hypothetical protein
MRMCTSYEYVCALLVGVCNPVHTYAGEYACDTRGREGTHEHMCWGVCAGIGTHGGVHVSRPTLVLPLL